jgi:hypothetical protein
VVASGYLLEEAHELEGHVAGDHLGGELVDVVEQVSITLELRGTLLHPHLDHVAHPQADWTLLIAHRM